MEKETNENQRNQDTIAKVKIIVMYQIGKPILSHPRLLKQLEKKMYERLIQKELQTKTNLEIDNEFNEICNSELFSNLDYMLRG